MIALMIVVFPLCKSRALSEKSRHCGSILAHIARLARNKIKERHFIHSSQSMLKLGVNRAIRYVPEAGFLTATSTLKFCVIFTFSD